jgi:hypothetical protein
MPAATKESGPLASGFSLRLVDGLIGVDAAHILWHAHGGPHEVPNGLALCALHHRLLDHRATRSARTYGCGPSRPDQAKCGL